MSKKILSLISIFFLMLFALTACKKAEGIISIQVEGEMVVGETYQVKYELENIDEEVALTWKVSDTGIAELDSKALTIKALKAGSFTLTVTAESGETASKQVTVVEGDEPATKYTITYELNGGTASNAPAEYDGTKDVTLPAPTKEGYEFKGWYENADFSGNAVEKIAAGSTGNKTFYAKWEEVKSEETYTITYEVNGGTLSGETTSYTAKDEVTLVAPTFAGYTFAGWYEAADFSGSKVEKLAVGSTGNKTFYAKWEEVEYTITYEVNGGTLDGEETSYTVESQDITLVEPTKEGYIFKGWYANANFSGSAVEKVAAGSTGNKTFYAKWEAEKVEDEDKVYTISYVTNGGTLANAPTEYDGSETVYLVNPLRRGYTFQGWYETATFAGKTISSIAKGTTGDVKLYAKWVAINYSITYNFNGGAWGEERGATSFTVAKEIELVAPVRAGYTFNGWYKDASFSGTAVEKIGKGTVGSIDLYAKWEANEYTITYNLNEGSWAEGVVADTTFTPDDVITLAEPVRTKYNFLGWYETEDFQGDAVTEIAAGTIENKVFYAKWEEKVSYTIAQFAEQFIDDFNTAAGTSITKATMVSGTASAIKTVIANEEFYNKYQWLFEYIAEDLKAKNEGSTNWIWQEVMVTNAFYDDLAKDLATATTTINLSAAPGPNGRTLLRVWLSCLVNENLCEEKVDYKPLVTDFSAPEEQAKFLAAYAASKETQEPSGPTDAELLAADKEALTLVAETEVDVTLTLEGTNGSVIAWSVTEGDAASIEEGVLKVTRGSEDATVKLTATLTLGEATDTKEFTLVIKAEEQGQPIDPDSVTYDDIVASVLSDFGLTAPVSIWTENVDDKFLANLEKWGCLLDYFLAVRTDEGYSAKFTELKNGTNLTGNVDPYVITGEFAAFVGKKQVTYPSPDPDIVSADYSKPEVQALIWDYVSKDLANIKYGALSFELNGGEVSEDLPTEYKMGTALTLPVPTKAGYVFLGWTLASDSTDYITVLPATTEEENVTLYAQWKFDALYVGAGLDYETVTEALEAAEEGDIIIVAAGTYDEDLVIDKKGIILLGANTGIAYDGERTEETILNSVTVKADSVVVDGIKFSAFTAVTISGGNYTTVKNCIMHGTPSTERTYVVLINDDTQGFSLLNSSINETNALTHTRAIQAEGVVVKDIVIRGNYIGETLKSTSTVYIDCIKFSDIAGNITIEDNTISWPGDNFTIFIGSESTAANTIVNINNNVFTSERVSSGIAVRYLPASATVNITGNSLTKVSGTVIQTRGTGSSDTTTEATVNISNNAFNDTSAKIQLNHSLKNVTIENNYFYTDITWSGVTGTNTNPAANAEAALAGIVKHNVTFVPGDGTIYSDLPATFVEGLEVSLSNVIPTLEGMRFVGWYDNAELTGEAVTTLGSQTTDVTLYAKYEALALYEVTYELGYDGVEVGKLVESAYEGTKITLPTPTLFGYTFLGWSTAAGSTEYITEFELKENTTIYANWTNAEISEVTYVLNGGNFTYANLDAVKADFKVDYTNLTGQGSYSIWNNSSKLGNVFTQSDHKWDWLLEYWAGVNTNSYGGNTNASIFLQMRDAGTCPDYYFYGVEITAWATSTQQSVYSGGLKSANYAEFSVQDAWWSYYSAHEENVKQFIEKLTLPMDVYNSETLELVGWYDNPEFTGEPLTEITESMTVYAKWQERTPVDSIIINNQIETINKFDTHQLEWTINPTDAYIKSVQITSSNPSVATISDTGLITALANGTTTITITSKSSSGASVSFDLTVQTPGYFDASYVTESYVEINKEISLKASYVTDEGTKSVVWSSLNDDIATVDEYGVVTGLKEGTAVIRAAVVDDATTYIDITVTVVSAEVSEALQLVLDSHESNVFVKYDLPIGYPEDNQGYYMDVYSSVSNIFYNHELVINEDKYLAAGDATGSYYTDSIKNEGLQFITVHYTGTFGVGADTDNIANNFTKSGTSVSIHYVTGNMGKYSDGTPSAEVFSTLSHDHGAYHAGDSNSMYYSNSTKVNSDNRKVFEWIPTGVAYDGCDYLDIEWTASDDFYYEINGKKTTIKLPDTWNYSPSSSGARNTDHIYGSDGLIDSQPDYLSCFTWGVPFSDRTPESFFNSQDFAVTVIDGEYYMGPTWWSYGQVLEGRICSLGGNRNSIGIESCVDKGSDVWYTWQVTAQLVAKLMDEKGLGIERVKGHHFFDGKDCPQPLLENDLEIWNKFIEMVLAEYKLRTTFADYEISFVSGNTDIVSDNGRIITSPEATVSVPYTVTIKNGSTTETITLATMVPSIYEK